MIVQVLLQTFLLRVIAFCCQPRHKTRFSKQFKKSFYFSPYLAFGASYLSQNSFSETGSGSNLLSIKKVDSSIFDTEIGTSIASDPIKVGKSLKFYPRLAAAYRQSWGAVRRYKLQRKEVLPMVIIR